MANKTLEQQIAELQAQYDAATNAKEATELLLKKQRLERKLFFGE